MYPDPLNHIIDTTIQRLDTELAQTPPFMQQQVRPWLEHLAGSNALATYFKHPLAFPAILLPWWMSPTPDPAFLETLTYSTINGYYYIRLIDNVMDAHTTTERHLLPALNFFHSQFQMPYTSYFPATHPFWEVFKATWFESAAATMQDATLTNITLADFQRISARKTCATRIPLAAVSYYHKLPLAPWTDFVDLFGGWHQLHNDLFDWQRDHAQGTPTYFLAEAARRRHPGEPVAVWVAREGFAWAVHQLNEWLHTLTDKAAGLGNPALLTYLETRQAMFNTRCQQARAGLRIIATLAKEYTST